MFLKKISLSGAVTALAVSAVFAVNVPVGYSVYSYEDLKIGDRAGMNGGLIGSKSNVLIGYDAVVSTDVIAKGDVKLYDRARVEGSVTAGGLVNSGAGSVITDGYTQNATVPAYTIPTKTFATGYANKTVYYDGTGSAAPGNYNKIEVLDRGTITLSSGTYNCNSFKISYDAKVNMNLTGGPIVINVKNVFNFKDRAVMLLPVGDDGSAIDIYYNGYSAVVIGNSSYAYGTFTAPNAAVTVADNAHFNGSLFAKKVELQPGLYATNMIDLWLETDSDGDDVPDYVEDQGDSDPGDSSCSPLVVVEGTYENLTDERAQKVTLSAQNENGYSRVYSMVFDKGTLQGDLIPIVDIVPLPSNRPDVPGMYDNYRLDGPDYGRIYHVEGEVTAGKQIYFGFPLSDTSVGIPKEFVKLYHYNENTSTWEDVVVDKVENGVAYAWVSSFSDWAAVVLGTIYKVGTSGTITYDAATIEDAISLVTAHANYYSNVANPETDAYSFAILVQEGTYTIDLSLTLPIRTSIIGGFNDDDFDASNTSFTWSDPKAKETILTAGSGLTGSMMVLASPGTYADVDVYVDGFTLTGGNFTTFHGAALNLSSSFHYKNVLVRNCVFKNNTGIDAAAVYLYNVSNITIESCFFVNNTITNTTTSGGSAIYANLVTECGVGVDVKSCVFTGNAAHTSMNGSTVTEYRTGGAIAAERYMSLYNCTFYDNTSDVGPGALLAMGYNGADFEDPIYIKNNIFFNNTTTQVDILKTPAVPFNDASNVFTDPGFASTTDLDGADNKWGTIDDGLMIKLTSTTCINQATYSEVPVNHDDLNAGVHPLVADHDAVWRSRNGQKGSSVNSADYKHDIGAYEYFVKVMCVGSANTVGSVNGNYQEYLKNYAEVAGFSIDFVGVSGKDFTAQAENIGGDASNPQSEKQTTDKQGACEVAGTVSSLGALATDAVDCDFALVMVGDAEMASLTVPNAITFAQSLVKTGRNVLMTDMIPDVIMAENDAFITEYQGTANADFGAVKKCESISNIIIDSKNIIDYAVDLPNAPADKPAFEFIAKSFWDQMITLLP